MNDFVQNCLACPLDGAFPLESLWNDAPREEGLLRCARCGEVFAVMRGVPHLTRPQVREIELEHQLLERLPQAPPEWAARLQATWREAESSRTEHDQALIDEGRYWGEFFRVHHEHGALTIFDARHTASHLPYLGYGSLAVDDRDRWRKHDHWPNPIGRRIIRFFEETRAAGARRYLDMACGGGQFGLEACYRGGKSIGYDLAAEALALGRAYARERGLDAHYVRAEPAALPFRDGLFDALVLKDALHHLPDVRGALGAVRRVAASGAPILMIDHVAEKPRWDRLRQRITERRIPAILRRHGATEGPEVFRRLSPLEFAGMENLEAIVREEIAIIERRGEMLYSEEMLLPFYLTSNHPYYISEILGPVCYALERIALLWGRPRFVMIRGNLK